MRIVICDSIHIVAAIRQVFPELTFTNVGGMYGIDGRVTMDTIRKLRDTISEDYDVVIGNKTVAVFEKCDETGEFFPLVKAIMSMPTKWDSCHININN